MNADQHRVKRPQMNADKHRVKSDKNIRVHLCLSVFICG
jgi:hypothetical protein